MCQSFTADKDMQNAQRLHAHIRTLCYINIYLCGQDKTGPCQENQAEPSRWACWQNNAQCTFKTVNHTSYMTEICTCNTKQYKQYVERMRASILRILIMLVGQKIIIIIPISALTLLVWQLEGHLACKTLGVGLLVVMIWLDICTSYSSSCHHYLHHP